MYRVVTWGYRFTPTFNQDWPIHQEFVAAWTWWRVFFMKTADYVLTSLNLSSAVSKTALRARQGFEEDSFIWQMKPEMFLHYSSHGPANRARARDKPSPDPGPAAHALPTNLRLVWQGLGGISSPLAGWLWHESYFHQIIIFRGLLGRAGNRSIHFYGHHVCYIRIIIHTVT